MKSVRLPIPFRGAGNSAAYTYEPDGFAPPGLLRNFRVYDTLEDRARGGPRPGLARLFNTPFGKGPIQALASVVLSSSPGTYSVGSTTAIDNGTNIAAGFHSGNAWVLDPVPSVQLAYFYDVTGDGGPSTNSVNACRWTKDGAYAVVACNYLSGGHLRASIRKMTPAGVTVWTHVISGGSDRFVNAFCVGDEYVFVATNKYVDVLKLSDGTLLNSTEFDCNGWSSEVIELSLATLTEVDITGTSVTSEYLFIGFDGATAAGSRTGGVIEAGIYAANFRAGVMKCVVTKLDSIADLGPSYPGIAQVPFGTQLDPADPMYEAKHNYWRVAEQSRTKGFGCRIKALRAHTDGSVYVARTNQGWGPTSAYRPSPTEASPDSGGVATGNPFISAFKINRDGTLALENDAAGSIVGNGSGEGAYSGHPHFNDINNPTFEALAVSSSGDVALAGRTNESGTTVSCLGSDGTFKWARKLVGAGSTNQVFQAAAEYDASSSCFWFGGVRNSVWDGSDPDGSGPLGSQNAHLWKLGAADGAPVGAFDLKAPVSALCVSVKSDGTVLYGTDKV